MCCSLFWCVAVCGVDVNAVRSDVLQCNTVLQCIAVCCINLQCVALRCSVERCVAVQHTVCSGVLQFVSCSVFQSVCVSRSAYV